MSNLKTGDVCIITKRIWGGHWAQGTPDYIGMHVKLLDDGGMSESGERTFTVKFITDKKFGNGKGRIYSKNNPPSSTIQVSALKKLGFGDWISKIEKATWKATKL